MNDFEFYLKYGWSHILAFDALDHLLFLLVLAIPYQFKYIWRVVLLATGFTLGHSLTLALVAKQWIFVDSYWIELLIPVTIIAAGIYNFIKTDLYESLPGIQTPLILNTIFGLVHGMGFAGLLTAVLGKEEQLLWPIFSFNLGIELAQIVVLVAILIVKEGIVKYLPTIQAWVVKLSYVVAIAASIIMIIDRT
jgi:hypothetical protein